MKRDIFRDSAGNIFRDNTTHGVVWDDGSGNPCGCCPASCVHAARSYRCSDDTVESYTVRLNGVKTDGGCLEIGIGAASSASYSGNINGFDMCLPQDHRWSYYYSFFGPGPLTVSYFSGPDCTGLLGTNSDIKAGLINDRTLEVAVGGIDIFGQNVGVAGYVKCNESYVLANQFTHGDLGTRCAGYDGVAEVRPCCNPAP